MLKRLSKVIISIMLPIGFLLLVYLYFSVWADKRAVLWEARENMALSQCHSNEGVAVNYNIIGSWYSCRDNNGRKIGEYPIGYIDNLIKQRNQKK